MANTCQDPKCIRDLIGNLLQEALPYFVTGSHRFRMPQRLQLLEPRLSSTQLHSLEILNSTRGSRDSATQYIYERLAPNVLLLLEALHRDRLYLIPAARTSLIMTLIIGFLAHHYGDENFYALFQVTKQENLAHVISVYESDASAKKLTLFLGDPGTVDGFTFDFSGSRFFQNPFA